MFEGNNKTLGKAFDFTDRYSEVRDSRLHHTNYDWDGFMGIQDFLVPEQ